MVDTGATVALETIRDFLVDEVKFLSNVSNQVNQVEEDLRTMHCLLMDADKWSGPDPNSLRNWTSNLQKLASEAETVLEKYAVKVTSKKEGKTLKEKLKRCVCIPNECFSVHQVGKKIEYIRSHLGNLMEQLKSLSGGEVPSNSTDEDEKQYLLRLRYAHEVDQHFVGMEKDIKCLVSRVKDDQNSPVISICGMGGLGKTTLARKIYNHKDVQACFDARAWVCVTQQFNPKTVLSQILRQLTKDQGDNLGVPELVEQVHNVVAEKKCVIVIDDIWEIDHWDILKPAFPITSNCKVVLTTRNEKIVAQDCVYKLDFLTEDEGWELLHKIALLHRNVDPVLQRELRSFEEIGRQIVQKCGRLPLSISIIGGILHENRNQSLAEWEKVSGNIDSYLIRGEGVQANKRVEHVLDLSYNTLPYYLKPCFLYLGCFPEDEKIETEKLYLLWIAEGLISSQKKRSNETLRDVAERYLTELIFRCMVQVSKDDEYTLFSNSKSCQLHDLIRDLCLSKAEEDKFIKCVSYPKDPFDGTSITRLAVCVEDHYATPLSKDEIKKHEDLKSFLVLKNRGVIYFEDGLLIDFDKSKCLRILALDGCQFSGGKLPRKVDKLIHLRYLGLFHSNVEELPPSICDMPYLQTLDLRVSFVTIRLPNVIYKMKRLRHLFLRKFVVIGGDKLILDGLKELETLEGIHSDKVCIAHIPKLTNLRKMLIIVFDMDSVSMIAHHLNNHQSQLRQTYLRIYSCDFNSEEDANLFQNILMSHSLTMLELHRCHISCGFPDYQQGMCRNLLSLQLFRSMLKEDVMEKVGRYPMLQVLYLSKIGLLGGTKMICSANSFPKLKYLFLLDGYNLEKWEVEEKAMPKLTSLEIARCMNLEMIPDGLRFISTLEELTIWNMPKEFNDKLRVVDGQPGEDYYKVSHIPSIRLT